MSESKKVPDQEKVKVMRQLLSKGGDEAVAKRYGEDALKSAEFKQAQRQREQSRRRQAAMRQRRSEVGTKSANKSAQAVKVANKPPQQANKPSVVKPVEQPKKPLTRSQQVSRAARKPSEGLSR